LVVFDDIGEKLLFQGDVSEYQTPVAFGAVFVNICNVILTGSLKELLLCLNCPQGVPNTQSMDGAYLGRPCSCFLCKQAQLQRAY
jgi:hypothetical protein